MIYSSFSSPKVAEVITTICLTILKKTNQSWKIVYSLLSLEEEEILDIYKKRKSIINKFEINYKYNSLTHLFLHQIPEINDKDIYNAEKILYKVLSEGWSIAFYNSEKYFRQWFPLKKQAPPLIFLKGPFCNHENNAGIAVVGTTQPSNDCVEITKQLVQLIVQLGAHHISGGAHGVDKIGHNTAIESGGFTRVILPCGILDYNIPYNWTQAIDNSRMQIISPWIPSAKWELSQAVRRNLFIASMARMGCILQPSNKGGSFRVAQNLLARNLTVFVYNPQKFAKALKYVPKALPLTTSTGKLNHSLIEQAIIKIKGFKEEPIKELFEE